MARKGRSIKRGVTRYENGTMHGGPEWTDGPSCTHVAAMPRTLRQNIPFPL